jgi:hypothetical protein
MRCRSAGSKTGESTRHADARGKRTHWLDMSATFTAAQTARHQLVLDHDQNDGPAHPNRIVAELRWSRLPCPAKRA